MPNALGGMVFIVAGIAMGYWVLTGRAGNFLYALKTGSGSTTSSTPPITNPQNPGSGTNTLSGNPGPLVPPGQGVATTTWGPQSPGGLYA